MPKKPKSESEIVMQYDPNTAEWNGWTDMPDVAKKWKKLGWPVEVNGFDQGGNEHSWRVKVEQGAVKFRRRAVRKPVDESSV